MKILNLGDIILVDKPKGISSFGVIRELRRELGVKKMGHSGTLDPLATGLMIVCAGEKTKKLNDLIKLPKTYEAAILLGVKTDTGDLEGKIIEEKEVLGLDTDKVKKAAESLVGKITLPVPLYSAIKVKGKRLYKSARRGEKVSLPKREMEILNIEFKGLSKEGRHYIMEVVLDVKSGTYIRSIVEELGRRFGLPTVLSELRRTRIGGYKIEDVENIQ